jgi:lipopolysaccharide transport system permease protein
MAETHAQVPTSVYTPESTPRLFAWGPLTLRSYLALNRELIAAQIKKRYRYTAVGLAWTVIYPLLQMFVYAFVFGSIFSADRANFRLMLLAGLLPWQAFSTGLLTSVRSLTVDRDLLRKTPFPSEALPLSAVGTALFNFAIVFVMYLTYMGVRGFPVLAHLHWVLIAVLIEAVFLAGLALVLSPSNVYLRDIEQFVAFGVWIWFFLTPIIYPLARLDSDQARLILGLNPMAGVITTIQTAVVRGDTPPLDPLLSAGGAAVVMFFIGWRVFRRLQYDLPKAV